MNGNLNKGDIALVNWQYGIGGSFSLGLMELISKADGKNLALLRKAYPDEVDAYQRFSRESGYWEAVVGAMNAREGRLAWN